MNIVFDEECGADHASARIGGHALLPAATVWPENPNGDPLVLLASVPVDLLHENNIHIGEPGQILSIFVTYSYEDWFLDLVTYHGHAESAALIQSGYTKVIVHNRAAGRSEAKLTIPSHQIALLSDDSETGSHIGGQPIFLQNNKLPLINNMTFALQLYSGSFPKGFEDVLGLSDAVGFLFVDRHSGIFFSQCT